MGLTSLALCLSPLYFRTRLVTENNNLEGVKVHFFAQILEESGTSLRISQGESLNYSAARLKDGEYLNGDWVKGDEEAGISGYYENGTNGKVAHSPISKSIRTKLNCTVERTLMPGGMGLFKVPINRRLQIEPTPIDMAMEMWIVEMDGGTGARGLYS